MEIKLLFSTLWTLLSVGAFLYYYYSILKWETKPHIFTWLIFTISLWTAFIVQIQSWGWYGSYVTLIEFLWCLVAFLLWIKYWEKNITKSDKLCLILALFSLFLYLNFKLAIISTILVILVDILAIIPTYRKSYSKPYEETMVVYIMSAWVYMFAISWLENYSFATYGYALSIVLADILFVIYLAWRRRVFSH